MTASGWRDKSKANLQASKSGIERFRHDTFGFSVHWGLYSIGANREWLQALEKIPREEYAKLKQQFNPVEFSADEWISLAVDAGASAFMVTTKHHDGFCLFDSKYTDFSSACAPSKKDLIAEMAEACQKRDVSLHFYHSLIDWHHPLAGDCQFNPPADFAGYCDYLLAQVKELCTNYGHVAGFLFDGWWPDAKADDDQVETVERHDWPLTELYDLIHRLQPDAMITNNHHILPLPGEDYQVWEMDLPGENTAGFNCEVIGGLPTMAWITSHGGWSWQRAKEFKSAETIAEMHRRCKKIQSAMFYNVGPMGSGKIDPAEVEILRKLASIER